MDKLNLKNLLKHLFYSQLEEFATKITCNDKDYIAGLGERGFWLWFEWWA